MKELNAPYNPKENEEKIYRLWAKSGYFNPDKLPVSKKAEPFVVVLPPPNITGSLHLGHALNAACQDILIRYRRMKGFKTLWVPGTDHAGIATQNVVEKELKKEGLARHDLGREKFTARVWIWKEKYGGLILSQLKKIGASCDWSRQVFTLDENYAAAVAAAFIHYHKKRLIYRSERVVNWCPRCRTGLSDLEVEYREEKGKLYRLKYPLKKPADGREFIAVATTRPETMLGDAAVAVNPKDRRYRELVGKTAVLPIQNREIPIIADAAVDAGFGTGAVKVTPAASIIDSKIAERHKLPRFKIIDERGKMTEESKICAGLGPTECRHAVIKKLEELKLVQKTEDYLHNVSRCYRCGQTLEQIPSKQWFLKMDNLAKTAVAAVKSGRVKFHPKRFEKIYFDWLSRIEDWCLSRQIWWGHRLPVFFCEKKPEEEQFVVSAAKPRRCPFCGRCGMKQSEDVLDTWFSSALWPFAVFKWPKKTADLEKFYPTQVLSTARDIINLWVARMVFSGLEFMKKEPFAAVYVHPTILTKDGKRMSKSLGTGVDPVELGDRYGYDALRFGLIWQNAGGQDIRWSEEPVVAGKKFANKIWNASRFVALNAGAVSAGKPPAGKLTPADKKILAALNKIKRAVETDLQNFRFGSAVRRLYGFFWHDFCDRYLETSKKQMEDRRSAKASQRVLSYVLGESLKMLHPFMPFLTEKIWELLKPAGRKGLLMIEKW